MVADIFRSGLVTEADREKQTLDVDLFLPLVKVRISPVVSHVSLGSPVDYKMSLVNENYHKF